MELLEPTARLLGSSRRAHGRMHVQLGARSPLRHMMAVGARMASEVARLRVACFEGFMHRMHARTA